MLYSRKRVFFRYIYKHCEIPVAFKFLPFPLGNNAYRPIGSPEFTHSAWPITASRHLPMSRASSSIRGALHSPCIRLQATTQSSSGDKGVEKYSRDSIVDIVDGGWAVVTPCQPCSKAMQRKIENEHISLSLRASNEWL